MRYSDIATTSQILWRIIESYGQDPAPIFDHAGLDTRKWQDPRARFDDESLDRAWSAALALVGDPCMGLRAADFWHPSQLHALGFAWFASATLYEAMQRLVRYFVVVSSSTELRLQLAGDQCELGIDRMLTKPRTADQGNDVFWAVLVSMCRTSLGEGFAPSALFLSRPEPDCAAAFYRLFQAAVNFSAPGDRMIFRRSDVERPLVTGNRELALASDQLIANYLTRLDGANIAERVRTALIESLSTGTAGIEDVASRLHLSVRSLQRRLADAETRFKEILDQTRHELALEYIKDGATPIQEVSYLLGYSDQTNFSRAFKRWTGKNPADFRAAA